jgi:hypothetical protein
MGWGYGGYNTAQIPALSTFDEVKKHHDSVVPIRGRSKETRPLGKRRNYCHMTIVRNTRSVISDDEPLGKFMDTYAYQLYGTNCIEWFPDGRVHVKHDGWNSPTTMQFMTYSLAKLGRIDSVRGKWYFVNKQGKNFLLDKGITLVKEGDVYVAESVVVENRYKVNRKVLNALRKKYKNFLDYGKTTLSIEPHLTRLEVAEASHGLSFNNVQLTPSYNWNSKRDADVENRAKLFLALDKVNESGDLNMMYEVMTYVACNAGNFDYRSQRILCTPQKFAKFFDDVLKYQFADEIFTVVPVEGGEQFHDNNKKYFKKT